MNWVWDHSPQKEGSLLVLLALADFAHDDGGGAYPSVKTLAAKARMSERNTQYCLRKLEATGEIVSEGKHESGVTIWRVVLPSLGGAKSAPAKSAPGAMGCTGGVQWVAPKPSLEPSDTPLSPPKGKSSPKKRCTVPDDFVLDAALTAYAVQRGWDARRAAEEFEAFRLHHGSRGNLMASWPMAWQLWVRNGVKFDRQRGGGPRKTQANLNKGGTGRFVG